MIRAATHNDATVAPQPQLEQSTAAVNPMQLSTNAAKTLCTQPRLCSSSHTPSSPVKAKKTAAGCACGWVAWWLAALLTIQPLAWQHRYTLYFQLSLSLVRDTRGDSRGKNRLTFTQLLSAPGLLAPLQRHLLDASLPVVHAFCPYKCPETRSLAWI